MKLVPLLSTLLCLSFLHIAKGNTVSVADTPGQSPAPILETEQEQGDPVNILIHGVAALTKDKHESPNLWGPMITAESQDGPIRYGSSLGLLWGSNTTFAYSDDYYDARFRSDMLSVPITVHVTFTQEIFNGVELYATLRAGGAANSWDSGTKDYYCHSCYYDDDCNCYERDTTWAWILGGGGGIRIPVSENCKIFASYELWRSWYNSPAAKSIDLSRTVNPAYHLIQVGVVVNF